MSEKRTSTFWSVISLILLLIIAGYAIIFFTVNAERRGSRAWVFWNVHREWIWALGIAGVIGMVAYPTIRALFRTVRRLLKGRKVQSPERRPQ
jgi:hypothetical protein